MDSNFRSKKRVDSRRLPRELRFFWAVQSAIIGNVDLTVLPVNMKILVLANNQIMGTVSLLSLPQNMRFIDLHANDNQEIIYSRSLLPEGFELFHVFGKTSGHRRLLNPIDRIREKRRIKQDNKMVYPAYEMYLEGW